MSFLNAHQKEYFHTLKLICFHREMRKTFFVVFFLPPIWSYAASSENMHSSWYRIFFPTKIKIFIGLDISGYQVNVFLSQQKHTLWVLIRSASERWVPTTYVFVEKFEKHQYFWTEKSTFLRTMKFSYRNKKNIFGYVIYVLLSNATNNFISNSLCTGWSGLLLSALLVCSKM